MFSINLFLIECSALIVGVDYLGVTLEVHHLVTVEGNSKVIEAPTLYDCVEDAINSDEVVTV